MKESDNIMRFNYILYTYLSNDIIYQSSIMLLKEIIQFTKVNTCKSVTNTIHAQNERYSHIYIPVHISFVLCAYYINSGLVSIKVTPHNLSLLVVTKSTGLR